VQILRQPAYARSLHFSGRDIAGLYLQAEQIWRVHQMKWRQWLQDFRGALGQQKNIFLAKRKAKEYIEVKQTEYRRVTQLRVVNALERNLCLERL
jgi:hypothetical protein